MVSRIHNCFLEGVTAPHTALALKCSAAPAIKLIQRAVPRGSQTMRSAPPATVLLYELH